MARPSDKTSKSIGLPVLGAEGDTCAKCGSVLATDQRYCLNCGASRAEPRLDFTKHLAAASDTAVENNGAVRAPSAQAQWSPIAAVGAIAVLGVMLLLGVLIGKEDNEQTTTTTPAATTTAPAATTPTTPPVPPDQAAPGAAPPAPAPAPQGSAQGGAGSAAGSPPATGGDQGAKSP